MPEFKLDGFLPPIVELNFRRMVAENLLNEKEKAFFTDNKLTEFWGSVDKYLNSIQHPECTENASAFLIGCFLGPLKLYGHTGTRERPSIKIDLMDRQRKADKLRKDAVDHARQLSAILQQLEELKSYNPETMLLMRVIETLIGGTGNYCGELPADVEFMRTHRAIDFLEESFRKYPDTDELFNDLPGMRSNKAGWRDWFREARYNLTLLLRIHPGELEIRQTDWKSIANVLFDETISSQSVSDVFKKNY
ncbi:MAG: hypothetical protein NMNS02_00730 [Nitrosomonas sp.]|nr:MAG: hypothetical protein NMNS02_00730 [Nitrosomonas sp.]